MCAYLQMSKQHAKRAFFVLSPQIAVLVIANDDDDDDNDNADAANSSQVNKTLKLKF